MPAAVWEAEQARDGGLRPVGRRLRWERRLFGKAHPLACRRRLHRCRLGLLLLPRRRRRRRRPSLTQQNCPFRSYLVERMKDGRSYALKRTLISELSEAERCGCAPRRMALRALLPSPPVPPLLPVLVSRTSAT